MFEKQQHYIQYVIFKNHQNTLGVYQFICCKSRHFQLFSKEKQTRILQRTPVRFHVGTGPDRGSVCKLVATRDAAS